METLRKQWRCAFDPANDDIGMDLEELGEQTKHQFHNDPALGKMILLKKIFRIDFWKLDFFKRESVAPRRKEAPVIYRLFE